MLTSGLNPNIVKTALDRVFLQEFDGLSHPEHATAEDGMVFMQSTIDRAAIIEEVFQGVGEWGQKAELANVPEATPRVGDQITHSVTEFAKSVDVSKNLFDDDQHNVVQKMIRDCALKGRVTRDKNAFSLFRNAFTTTLTADGAALISDTHTTLSGDTVDNKLTDALSESTLNDAIIKFIEQKDQDGVVVGLMPKTLLVPAALYKKAVEITEAELRSATGGGTDGVNEPNVYSSKYGLVIKTTPYLGAVVGGSDTAWFLLGDMHAVNRWVRQGIQTALVDWKFERNNNYVYKASFREALGATTYHGIVGSDGTT